jgi:hypothetical protein
MFRTVRGCPAGARPAESRIVRSGADVGGVQCGGIQPGGVQVLIIEDRRAVGHERVELFLARPQLVEQCDRPAAADYPLGPWIGIGAGLDRCKERRLRLGTFDRAAELQHTRLEHVHVRIDEPREDYLSRREFDRAAAWTEQRTGAPSIADEH